MADTVPGTRIRRTTHRDVLDVLATSTGALLGHIVREGADDYRAITTEDEERGHFPTPEAATTAFA